MIQRVNIYVLGSHNIPEFSRMSGIPTETLERKYREAVAKRENCVFEVKIKERKCRSLVITDSDVEPSEESI